jgi:hypothetical protein
MKQLSKLTALLLLPALGFSEAGKTGARVPWTAYPAEEARHNATVHGPSRTFGTPEAEAVGRSYVRLDEAGEFVEFDVKAPANTLVLRYSIPDAPAGGGLEAALGLLINGAPVKKLKLTSRFAWNYGDYPFTNDPKAGRARHFFDEVRTFIPEVVQGDVIRLQKEADDAADYCLVDFIDLEQVAPPLDPPDGSLSIAGFGAVPNDGKDDTAAITNCFNAARAKDRTVWIPAGRFLLNGHRIHVSGIRVRGAGMWHSVLTGTSPMFEGTGQAVEFSDLAIFGDITHRDNNAPDNAFNGNLGKGSRFTNLWIEHVKCGFWTTQGTEEMLLSGSRIRNVMADGLNFCDGTSRSTVEQCHLRSTGDDALATWSPTGDWSSKKPCLGNRFLNNTIQQPWMANGIAVYGGGHHVIAGNVIAETVISGAGIHISSGFEAVPFSGPVRIENNRISGAGGDSYIGETVGGLWLYAKDSDIEVPVVVEDIELIGSRHSAVTVHGPKAFRDVRLNGVIVRKTGEFGLHIKDGAAGSLTVANLQISGAPRGDVRNDGRVSLQMMDEREESP